jgi:hypothetical protein
MRIDPETFLALTLLMGTGAAVGIAVMSSSDGTEPAAIEAPVEPVAARASETPTKPATEKPAETAASTTPATTTTPAVAPAVEEPWVDPFPIEPEDPNAVPGPDFEGF